jgi:hypothetical protein
MDSVFEIIFHQAENFGSPRVGFVSVHPIYVYTFILEQNSAF